MNMEYLAGREAACKAAHRFSPLESLVKLAGGGAELPMTAPHG
jgi:hypothetical protein